MQMISISKLDVRFSSGYVHSQLTVIAVVSGEVAGTVGDEDEEKKRLREDKSREKIENEREEQRKRKKLVPRKREWERERERERERESEGYKWHRKWNNIYQSHLNLN